MCFGATEVLDTILVIQNCTSRCLPNIFGITRLIARHENKRDCNQEPSKKLHLHLLPRWPRNLSRSGQIVNGYAKQKLRRDTEFLWCGREDLNLQSLARTSTSSWRVYHSATSARGLPTRRDNNRSRKKDQVSNVRSFPVIIFIPIDSTEISNRVP